jgi:hypothetical protein
MRLLWQEIVPQSKGNQLIAKSNGKDAKTNKSRRIKDHGIKNSKQHRGA